MRLVYENTDHEVKVGDTAKLVDGEVVTVKKIEEPRHRGSTGRVIVQTRHGEMSYFPAVIGAEWVDREDQDEDF